MAAMAAMPCVSRQDVDFVRRALLINVVRCSCLEFSVSDQLVTQSQNVFLYRFSLQEVFNYLDDHMKMDRSLA